MSLYLIKEYAKELVKLSYKKGKEEDQRRILQLLKETIEEERKHYV